MKKRGPGGRPPGSKSQPKVDCSLILPSGTRARPTTPIFEATEEPRSWANRDGYYASGSMADGAAAAAPPGNGEPVLATDVPQRLLAMVRSWHTEGITKFVTLRQLNALDREGLFQLCRDTDGFPESRFSQWNDKL